ncbi:hypothetical protein U5A82_19565 [Sphingobium sp. CR2-8]|uniref:hypothetical protein n=1 Tax=Sphingobium sp. CR2-8 TaxID=1306534 RepID=UPI002DB815B7|nr:hypothetical protein [Sphingobium sp. CR2-8]MEC3912591.1 hypothetical protein [Sphingobium sp. CR2-8]
MTVGNLGSFAEPAAETIAAKADIARRSQNVSYPADDFTSRTKVPTSVAIAKVKRQSRLKSKSPFVLFLPDSSDESGKAFDHDQRAGPQLDGLDPPLLDQLVHLGSTNPDHPAGIGDAHSDRRNLRLYSTRGLV